MADSKTTGPAEVLATVVDQLGEAQELIDGQANPGTAGETEEEFGILIGPPAAFISGAEGAEDRPAHLITRDRPADLQSNPHAIQGCIATVGCGCGQMFIMNLTTDHLKRCPGCGAGYTSLLVVAAQDDDQIMGDVLEHLRFVNEGDSPDTETAETAPIGAAIPEV